MLLLSFYISFDLLSPFLFCELVFLLFYFYCHQPISLFSFYVNILLFFVNSFSLESTTVFRLHHIVNYYRLYHSMAYHQILPTDFNQFYNQLSRWLHFLLSHSFILLRHTRQSSWHYDYFSCSHTLRDMTYVVLIVWCTYCIWYSCCFDHMVQLHWICLSHQNIKTMSIFGCSFYFSWIFSYLFFIWIFSS